MTSLEHQKHILVQDKCIKEYLPSIVLHWHSKLSKNIKQALHCIERHQHQEEAENYWKGVALLKTYHLEDQSQCFHTREHNQDTNSRHTPNKGNLCGPPLKYQHGHYVFFPIPVNRHRARRLRFHMDNAHGAKIYRYCLQRYKIKVKDHPSDIDLAP